MAEFPDALFENALEFTRDLLPAVARQPIQRRLNGVFSFTPDANSILGEWPETRGLWLAEAVWVTHGAGVGALMAEWLVDASGANVQGIVRAGPGATVSTVVADTNTTVPGTAEKFQRFHQPAIDGLGNCSALQGMSS